MSRSDYPPGYDDTHTPLYPPQGGNYPPPPAYGFPSFGGGQPGQPSAPYPPSQPGGYAPPGPYPGQPYPGGHPGMGYPTPPPMPPVIPPTIPSDVLSSGDEFAAAGSNWDDLSIRHAFIRKVYLILAAQLLVTTAVVAIFTFVQSVKVFVQRNQAVYWASYAVYIVTHLVLVCCKGPRRKFPWNVILLGIFSPRSYRRVYSPTFWSQCRRRAGVWGASGWRWSFPAEIRSHVCGSVVRATEPLMDVHVELK